MTYDCIVVGAGPAGLSGALILGRCRRSVLVCDAGEPRNARSAGLHGYLLTVASNWQRVLLIVAGMGLIKPGLATDLIGAGLAVAVIAAQVAARRAALKPEIAAE